MLTLQTHLVYSLIFSLLLVFCLVYHSYLSVFELIFKVRLSPFKKDCVSCLIENPLKMMKNTFYFILKALFVLKIFTVLSRLFGHVGKIKLSSKFVTSQPGLQTIAVHILPNISQSKGSQTMKFGNKRNIFLQKLCRE